MLIRFRVWRGWLLVAGAVVGYDAFAMATGCDTLSAAFRKGWRHPWGRYLIAGFAAGLVVHLLEEGIEPDLLTPAGGRR